MFSLYYKKNNNKQLFDYLEETGFQNPQNFFPLLSNFFQLDENNCNKINLNQKNNKDLEKFFKSSNSKAIIVRPDRFILSSCKSVKDFKSYLKKNLSILV